MASTSEQEEQGAEIVTSYRNYEKEAHEIVAKLIESSLKRLIREQSEVHTCSEDSGTTDNKLIWPRGDDFTVEKGREAIDTLVKV